MQAWQQYYAAVGQAGIAPGAAAAAPGVAAPAQQTGAGAVDVSPGWFIFLTEIVFEGSTSDLLPYEMMIIDEIFF